MSGGEPERPLQHLNGVESALALERLRGEMWIEITRLNGETEKLEEDVARTERFNKEALNLAQGGLDKHLSQLNDNATKTLAAQAQHAQDILKTTAELQSKNMAERDKKEIDARLQKLEERIGPMERSRWLPMVSTAALGLGVGAAIARLLVP